MRIRVAAAVVLAMMTWPAGLKAEDVTTRVRRALERSTLDQPGTKPFHLKAELAPSLARDSESGRTGEVEIWWVDPGTWRWEVRSAEFHQIEVEANGHNWQKSEGSYFPEWLREVAVALVRPVPDAQGLLRRVKDAEVQKLAGYTYLSWATVGSDGTVSKAIEATFAITDSTGLEYYGRDVGWSGLFGDYRDFHGRMVARTLRGGGSPEVTAKVTVLEDLGATPVGFFDGEAKGGDGPRLRTVVVEETKLRKNLLPGDGPVWPELASGPLEGASIADVVVDREGKVREVGPVVTDNPGVRDAVSSYIREMRFKPYVVDGAAVQVVSTITLGFKTVRPAGAEIFESAKTFFDRARRLGFPAGGVSGPYILRAEFTTRGSSGKVETGIYTDTWLSDSKWKREAVLGNSRVVRSRNGEKRYQVVEGPDAAVLRLVLYEMEPIPATDAFADSDWRIEREVGDGTSLVRVARGREDADGRPGPKDFDGFWFDASGQLVRSYADGMEERRRQMSDFGGVKVAHQVEVMVGGSVAMRINLMQLGPAGAVDAKMFTIKGHETGRQLTSEVR
jgi:hypothetical protein